MLTFSFDKSRWSISPFCDIRFFCIIGKSFHLCINNVFANIIQLYRLDFRVFRGVRKNAKLWAFKKSHVDTVAKQNCFVYGKNGMNYDHKKEA